MFPARKQTFKSNGKRNRSASGNCEKRSYRQIESTGKNHAVLSACHTAQFQQPRLPADPQSRDSQKRQPYSCNQKTRRRPHISPCKLPHGNRENQIASAKKHTEQHTGYKNRLFQTQTFLHCNCPFNSRLSSAFFPCILSRRAAVVNLTGN